MKIKRIKTDIWILIFSIWIGQANVVRAEVLDYQAVLHMMQIENQKIEEQQIMTDHGEVISVLPRKDILYTKEKEGTLRKTPEKEGILVNQIPYGTIFQRTAVCENEWSQGSIIIDGIEYIGYIENVMLSEEKQIEEVQEDNIKVLEDVEVMDYPARKEGLVVGELLENDQVMRTGIIQGIWSQIYFSGNGDEFAGYVPSYVLDVMQDASDENTVGGTIHKSDGKGVFAEAIDGVTQEMAGDMTVPVKGQAGIPVAVQAGAVLKNMGVFRITHYCSCAICCGAYSNGITATGTICTTNRTIAVNPAQIPYGTKVVIGGQVYIAEDCGGAIGQNCIDIYVGTHEEGLQRGTYNTEVFILED